MDGVSPVPNVVHSVQDCNNNSACFSNSSPTIVHGSGINVATWNVEGVSGDKFICLIRVMRQYSIHILCITETHVEESLHTDDGYFVFFLAPKSNHLLYQELVS